MAKILTENWEKKEPWTLDSYKLSKGYSTAKKALSSKAETLVSEVKDSGLRGRGGAGFPTGLKWTFLPDNGKDRYLVINADEGEPGTFKDRYILELDPHKLIEGMIISCYANNINKAFIYVRGEFKLGIERLQKAVDDAYEASFLGKNIFGKKFNLDIVVHPGAGAYICGEETALIESLEGRRGQPRRKPPFFPAAIGLYGCPTIINNVETIAAVPWIIKNGASKYKKLGTEKSCGTKLFSISGHVNKPGVYEVELGIKLMDFVEKYAGGIKKGKKLKAIIPGGSSSPILTADECKDAALDFESMAQQNTMLGSGAIIVLAEDVSIVDLSVITARFYAHESCGQCTPCREGTPWIASLLKDIQSGNGTKEDIENILELCDTLCGTTVCVLADACAMPIRAMVQKYRHEFDELIKN